MKLLVKNNKQKKIPGKYKLSLIKRVVNNKDKARFIQYLIIKQHLPPLVLNYSKAETRVTNLQMSASTYFIFDSAVVYKMGHQ